MPLTLLRHATQKPPPGPLKVDVGNSLSQQLKFAMLLNEYGSGAVSDQGQLRLTGVLTGTNWASSTDGPALQVSVSGDHVQFNSFPFPSPLTSMTWYIRFNPTTFSSYMTPIDAIGRPFSIYLNTSSMYAQVGGGIKDFLNHTFTTNTWNDGVFVYDNTAGTITVYSNGIQTDSQALSGSASGAQDLCFGTNPAGGGSVYQGSYAHVFWWTRALSVSESLLVMSDPYAMFQSRTLQHWFSPTTPSIIPPGLGPALEMNPALQSAQASMMR